MNVKEIIDAIDTKTRFSFSRSAGAGGQNVNKVNTRVTARLPIAALGSLQGLGDHQLAQLRARLRGRINGEGDIVVHVQDERSQARNREIALERLQALVLQALAEKKRRRPTKPSAGARRARLQFKRKRGATKAFRRTVDPGDES